ncbi:MAG: transcriptional regulator [Anaerolinea sp.]|jgi:ArsR family transcriptional regulator|nr:transcriptional regulator [Anaerolinea sp.]
MHMIGSTLSEDRCETECIHPEHVRPLLGRTLSGEGALRVGDLFGLLADPTRARILHALTLTEELCVCDLALLLGLSVSALSHQLRLLRDRDAVARRKVGRIVYYRLADDHVRRLLTDALVHVGEAAQLKAAG